MRKLWGSYNDDCYDVLVLQKTHGVEVVCMSMFYMHHVSNLDRKPPLTVFFNRKNKGDVVQNRSETVTVSQGSFSPNPQKMVLGVILGIFVLNFDFLGGGLKHFLFSPLPGEMIQID